MRNVITMMNAMKFYKFDELVRERDEIQEKLSKDMDRPGFHKLMEKVRAKFFLNRG